MNTSEQSPFMGSVPPEHNSKPLSAQRASGTISDPTPAPSLPTAGANTPPPVPRRIAEAASEVQLWMSVNGHAPWQLMGICSRDHADKLASTQRALADCVEALKDATECCQAVVNIMHEYGDPKREKPFQWKDVCLQMYATMQNLKSYRKALKQAARITGAGDK